MYNNLYLLTKLVQRLALATSSSFCVRLRVCTFTTCCLNTYLEICYNGYKKCQAAMLSISNILLVI